MYAVVITVSSLFLSQVFQDSRIIYVNDFPGRNQLCFQESSVMRLQDKYGIFAFKCFFMTTHPVKLFQFLSTDIDECASNPCKNGGSCSDSVNGYSCHCRNGYTGTECETSKDVIHPRKSELPVNIINPSQPQIRDQCRMPLHLLVS